MVAKEKDANKAFDKLMKKTTQSKERQKKVMSEIGKHYKETKYATPKEARKGGMLQKKSVEEKNRQKRRSERYLEKHG